MDNVMDRAFVQTARWRVTIFYRSGMGFIDVDHDVEELSEIEGIVERGPDWNTIERIDIRLDRVTHAGLTIEKAGDV